MSLKVRDIDFQIFESQALITTNLSDNPLHIRTSWRAPPRWASPCRGRACRGPPVSPGYLGAGQQQALESLYANIIGELFLLREKELS